MKRSRIRCAFAGVLLSLLTPSVLFADSAYHVGPEDKLRVRVARHEEMGDEVEVLQDGRVTLPVVGTLSVSGLTVEQIRDLVVQGLRKKLVNPEVSIEVTRPRLQRIFVSGAVKMPQILDWKEGWRLTEALANAGGLVIRPEVARGTLFRLGEPSITLDLAKVYVDQDPTANLRLQPGDVIDIQEPPTVRIYVSGQVQKTGVYDLTRGRGALEALSLASGQTPAAALSKAYIQKKDGAKISIDLARLLNHGGAGEAQKGGTTAPVADVPMEAGDELVVPENHTKIAVFGKVAHPSTFSLRDGEETTVADAISMAGGFELRAEKSQIGIIRMVDGKQTVALVVDMNRLVKGKALNPVLQDRDVVFVPDSRRPNWTGQILPGIQALAGAVFFLK
jgi:polysaccharide export outer membrane protein